MGNFVQRICQEQKSDSKEHSPISPSAGDLANSKFFSPSDRKSLAEDKIFRKTPQLPSPSSPYRIELDNSDFEENTPISYKDFVWKQYIGKGSFGKVARVIKKNTGKEYAMKILKKKDFHSRGSLEYAVTEKNVLQKSQHPFIVTLHYSFQDDVNLYYCIEYVAGGELFKLLKQLKVFPLEQTRFYAAEVLSAMSYLHTELDTIYRDLKPENLLLGSDGHIKLTDFGLSKMGTLKTYSFCGTPEYLAPEIILNRGHSKSVDYWTFGCLIFEMMVGRPPFRNKNQNILFNLIKNVRDFFDLRRNTNFRRSLIMMLKT